MAIDLAAATTLPAQGDDTLDSGDTVLEVIYDQRAAVISIYFAEDDGAVCFDDDAELADGDGVGDAPQSPLVAGTWTQVAVPTRLGQGVPCRCRLFLTSTVAQHFYVVAEAEDLS